MTSVVALIPARAGSKRIPHKNTKLLAGVPLVAYTIAAAKQSGVFDGIVVCSDDDDVLVQATAMGVRPFLRWTSQDGELDINWVRQVVDGHARLNVDAFAILRPTSPFRSAETIRLAWSEFGTWCDSLRAVTPVSQHPGKMWTLGCHGALTPLLLQPEGQPWHSSPTQTLPKVYVQTAGLEIAWTRTVRRTGTIAGDRVLGFELNWPESMDINTEADWLLAETLVERGLATLPEV